MSGSRSRAALALGFSPPTAQDRLLDAQDRREVVAFPHAGEELGDVRGVETLAKQLVDGLQLGQVVVVIERRAALPARRVEQAAFTVRADIAWADTRNPREVVQSILSQPAHQEPSGRLPRMRTL